MNVPSTSSAPTWPCQPEDLAGQRRLATVRAAAYNAVARGLIAQRRIMWFLVDGAAARDGCPIRCTAQPAQTVRGSSRTRSFKGAGVLEELDQVRLGVTSPG